MRVEPRHRRSSVAAKSVILDVLSIAGLPVIRRYGLRGSTHAVVLLRTVTVIQRVVQSARQRGARHGINEAYERLRGSGRRGYKGRLTGLLRRIAAAASPQKGIKGNENFGDFELRYCGSPTLRTSSANLGSDRKLSN